MWYVHVCSGVVCWNCEIWLLHAWHDRKWILPQTKSEIKPARRLSQPSRSRLVKQGLAPLMVLQ